MRNEIILAQGFSAVCCSFGAKVKPGDILPAVVPVPMTDEERQRFDEAKAFEASLRGTVV